MSKDKPIWALYDNEKFLDLGTLEELAERRGVTVDTIRFYGSPTHLRRTNGKGLVSFKLDDENN